MKAPPAGIGRRALGVSLWVLAAAVAVFALYLTFARGFPLGETMTLLVCFLGLPIAVALAAMGTIAWDRNA